MTDIDTGCRSSSIVPYRETLSTARECQADTHVIRVPVELAPW